MLAEAQMMNTIEYRVDCQLLQHLHWDNNLGCRFPIGKLDQVAQWDAEKVRQFHERWYFPANATLYVVGDFHTDVAGVVEMIEQAFGAAEAAVVGTAEGEADEEEDESTPGEPAEAPRAPSGETRVRRSPTAAELIRRTRRRRRLAGWWIRTSPRGGGVRVQLFQHEHLSHVSFNIFSKLPCSRCGTWASASHGEPAHRSAGVAVEIQSRYAELDHEHYKRCELDHSDSAREDARCPR